MTDELFMVVEPSGTITAIHSDELVGLMAEGTASKRRASHVEPVNWLLRLAFRLLRAHTNDASRLAAFTRRWPCLWQADLAPSGGPILRSFERRSDAIAAEVEWLKARLATR